MRRDLRLLPLAGTVWAVALLCVFVPAAAVWAVGAGIVAAVAALAVWRRRGALTVVILASGAAVALSAALALPGRAEATAWGGRIVEATAEITSSASIGQDGRLWFDAQLTGIGSPGGVAHAAAPIRVGVDFGEGFDMGAGIRITGQAAQTDAGERSAIVVFASAAEVERTASGVFALAAELKGDFVSRSTALPEPGAGLLPGLAVGDTRAVTADLNDDMRASGLSHLTAVSGLPDE
ncbi:hypothetical protein QFZ53_002856 [Microbacterium natoriense]|uniref:DUF4131 domain-containing protein n=1 Tax=Microbacterium natoriense TaxID=284570 RepID=A0AAW8EYV8_9MICO|nr:hypothetical protein [Microbacterium natoriense]MDQ0648660.1 hypothetical protein [Microbacterium natoriense]